MGSNPKGRNVPSGTFRAERRDGAEPQSATPSNAKEHPHGEGGDPTPTNSAGGEVKFI